MGVARLVAVSCLAFALSFSAAQAERPIVDLHRLDAYFELFAGDSSVPWKAATVRLDTYSSAPVTFAVYAVDPVNVLTTGSNFSPRAIDVRRRRALLTFTFTPPGGYQFQSSQVNLPLGSREGFFVVEARRGDVGEQVWINRSRAGLIAKQSPDGVLFYCADLGTGMPLARMRVRLVVNNSFVTEFTDRDGLVRWNRIARPVFALAEWGDSYAFLNLLPQAPVPATIVGVRTDSAVVRAGGVVRIAGFARVRSGGVLRAAGGSALVALRSGARTLQQRRVPIDEAGAFSTALSIGPNVAAGDYTVLAQAGGGVGGATLHVDGDPAGFSLEVRAACGSSCDFRQDLALLVHASRPDAAVNLTVVRSPHVYIGYAPEITPWATTKWFSQNVRTDGNGNATVLVPRPLDGLASTYGVHAESGGATADTRVVVPTAQAAIALSVDRAEQSLGVPLRFDVAAERLDGTPLSNARVTVTLRHGTTVQEQRVMLDDDGHARGSFSAPEVGANLIFASVDAGGRATDAVQVQVDPQVSASADDGGSPDVRIDLNSGVYRPGEDVIVNAGAAGAQGRALITFESALGIDARVAGVARDRASARLRAVDAAGELRVGAAFVRDGAIEWSTVPVALAAPGRPHFANLKIVGERLAAGEPARLELSGESGRGTFVVRISRGVPSGSALFSSAPELLAIGLTTTQNSAPPALTWHPWVDSTGNHAQVLGFVRRTDPPEASLAQADTQTLWWRVDRGAAGGVKVVLPQAGRYQISVLEIADDGSVTAGSCPVEVP